MLEEEGATNPKGRLCRRWLMNRRVPVGRTVIVDENDVLKDS